MALSDNLKSLIFRSPSVVGNNEASSVTWKNAAEKILPDLIAIADAAGGSPSILVETGAATTISAMADGAPAQGTEDVPVALSGANYRLTTGDIALLALQDAFQGAITVDAATTANLAAFTYNNGAAGVGATITMNAVGAFPNQDGVPMNTVGRKLLVKNAATAAHRGCYIMTTAGTGSVAAVWTRMTTSDQAAEFNGQVVIVAAGTVNKRKIFSQTATVVNVGTDTVTYATTPAPNLTGYVKKDGSEDFTGVETWDFGGTDTTVISDSAVAISDGTLQGLLQKDLVQVSNAVGGTASMQEGAIGLVSATGDAAGMLPTGFTISPAAGGSMAKKFIKVSLSAAQIKSGNTVPVSVIPAAGAGTVNVPTSVLYVFTANTTPYTSNAFHLETDGSSVVDALFYSSQAPLSQGLDVTEVMLQNVEVGNFRLCATNKDIFFMADADSAAGDGTLDLYIEYNVITL